MDQGFIIMKVPYNIPGSVKYELVQDLIGNKYVL